MAGSFLQILAAMHRHDNDLSRYWMLVNVMTALNSIEFKSLPFNGSTECLSWEGSQTAISKILVPDGNFVLSSASR